MPTPTPLEPGLITRVVAGLRYVATGKAPDWFGPGAPMPNVVPAAQQPAVLGRAFDYPVAANQRIRPRDGEAVGFAEMRALADACDVLRLVIETRKDQIAKLRWRIVPREGGCAPDPRCHKIAAFFQSPDQEHDWDTWLRMLLEDLFVIDAPTLYPRRTRDGRLYALEPVDGATIKRILDESGRTPLPPDPAYQQILKGVPASHYTRGELIYRPRNPRTHKIYGYSPVEQIIVTVNIALRRQASLLEYYRSGSVPDALASVPKEWTPEQIAQFQTYWDALLEGDLAERRRLRFIPEGVSYIRTKEPALKDSFDEWLARLCCFAFSVSPTPLVNPQNRATADNAMAQAMDEGLLPLMQWVKNLIDHCLTHYFDAPDLEFLWRDDTSDNPHTQAQIMDIKLRNGSLTINEARALDGRGPLPGLAP